MGRDLTLQVNGSLTQIDGLSALTTVGRNLMIDHNPALTQIDGLGALATVGGNLTVETNGALCANSVQAIVNQSSVSGSVVTSGNNGSCP